MLFKLALRNIFRQRVRTAVTLAAIVCGVSGLILSGGFVQDVFVQLGEAIIHSQTGHAQVFRKDFIEKGARQPGRYLIEDPHGLAAQLAAVPMVKDVSQRLSFAGLLNNGRRDLAIIGEGVEPDTEARIGTYLRIVAGRQLTDADVFGVTIGEGVALALGLSAGDQVTLVASTLDGAMNTLDVEVIGVFESFSKEFDARAIRITLAAAQELLATPGANLLVISLHETRDTDAAVHTIQTLLPNTLETRSWKQLSDFYEKTLLLYERQFGVLQLIILIMVLLSVANSVNMAAFERMSEFGTMQALGNSTRHVFRQLVLENVLLGLMGAALGVLVGIVLALFISVVGIQMPPPPNANVGYTALIRIVPYTIVSAFVIGFAATALAALFPAHRVTRTPLVELLRQGS